MEHMAVERYIRNIYTEQVEQPSQILSWNNKARHHVTKTY